MRRLWFWLIDSEERRRFTPNGFAWRSPWSSKASVRRMMMGTYDHDKARI